MAINAYYHVTPAGAGAKNGADWDNAFGEPEFETFIEGGGLAAGDVVYIKEGTYTLDSAYNSSAINGTATAPIAFIGVKTETTNTGANVVYSDWARDSADRPFFDCGAYQFRVGSYYVFRNLSFQGSAANTVYVNQYCTIENCKFDNDVGSSTSQYVLLSGGYLALINCEVSAANCGGVQISASDLVAYCYFHDLTDATNGIGIFGNNTGCYVNNVFDNIQKYAIYFGGQPNQYGLNNTFYETDVSAYGTNGYHHAWINNLCEGNDVDGFKSTTQTDINLFFGNHGDDTRCTDMWDGVAESGPFADLEVTTGDPKFVDPANDDFRLQADSPCYGTAKDLNLGIGE